MKEDKLKALIKDSHGFKAAPAYLWQRIRQGVVGSETESAGGSVVDFEVPRGDAVREASRETDNYRRDEGSVVSFSTGRIKKSRKRAVISVAAAAACLILCTAVLFGSGILKKNNVQPGGNVNTPTPEIGDQNNGLVLSEKIPEVSIMVGDRNTEYEAELLAYSENPHDANGDLDKFIPAENPFSGVYEKAGAIENYTEYGRWVTMDFNGKAPDKLEVSMELYDLEGKKQWDDAGAVVVDSDITDGSANFRVTKNIHMMLSSDSSYYEQDFYNLYKVNCSWSDSDTGVLEANYYFIVKVGPDSGRFLATVEQTEPILTVNPGEDSWMYDESLITLTETSFYTMKESGGGKIYEQTDAKSLKVGDVVQVQYDGSDFNSGFPKLIEGCSVVVNPLDSEADGKCLKGLIEAYGTVSMAAYENRGLGEYYPASDASVIKGLLDYLDKVQVTVETASASEAALVTGDGASAGLWKLDFSFGDSYSQLTLYVNGGAADGELKHEMYASLDGGELSALTFDGADSAELMSDGAFLKFVRTLLLDSGAAMNEEQLLKQLENTIYEEVQGDRLQLDLKLNKGYSIDLNSDGVNEEIYVACPEYTRVPDSLGGTAMIIINGKPFSLEYYMIDNPDLEDFHIVDIDDTSDGYLEIAVRDDGPSADFVTHFFRYEDEELHYLGLVPGQPSVAGQEEGGDISFDGDGNIMTLKLVDVMQSWFVSAVFGIGADNVIAEKEQAVYVPSGSWDGRTATVKTDVVVYTDMKTDSSTLVIPAGTIVTFPVTDGKNWVLVQASDGSVQGWIYAEISEIITPGGRVQSQDVFDGLTFFG